jgi:hypothetical protein
VLVKQRDALGTKPLDAQQVQQRMGKLLEQQVALLERSVPRDLFERAGNAFADAGNIRDFALRVAQDIFNALGIAFDGGRRVAVAADAEAVLGGDLHQVRGF